MADSPLGEELLGALSDMWEQVYDDPVWTDRLRKFFADENTDVGGNAAYYVQEMLQRNEGTVDLLKLLADPSFPDSGAEAIVSSLANAFIATPGIAKAFVAKVGDNHPYLTAVVNFLKANKFVEPLLILCQNLFYAANDIDTLETFVSAGGVVGLTSVLGNSQESAILGSAAAALNNMITSANKAKRPEMIERFATAEVYDAFGKALDNPKMDHATLSAVLQVFGQFSKFQKMSRDMILGGFCDSAAAAISQKPMIYEALVALANLSRHAGTEDVQAKIISSGVFTKAILLVTPGQESKVQEAASVFVANISSYADMHFELATTEHVQRIFAVIKDEKIDENFRGIFSTALYNFSCLHDSAKEELVGLGLNHIAALLDGKFGEKMAKLLVNLSHSLPEAFCQNDSLMAILWKVLQAPTTLQIVKEQVGYLFIYLASDDKCRQYFFKTKSYKAVFDIIGTAEPALKASLGNYLANLANYAFGYDHIKNNTPVPVRSQKLNFLKLA